MTTDKSLFLYIYKCYTLAIVPLHTALNTVKAHLLLEKDQHAVPFNRLKMPAYNFQIQDQSQRPGTGMNTGYSFQQRGWQVFK
jgi:hypothetical protein